MRNVRKCISEPSLGNFGVLRESMLLAGLKTFLSFSETVKQYFRCECKNKNGAHQQ